MSEPPSTAETKPKPRGRLWQFGLRTLLVVCLALGGLFGVIAKIEHDARRQREVIAIIERNGGYLEREYIGASSGWSRFVRERFGGEYVDHLTEMGLGTSTISDHELATVVEYLSSSSHLRVVILNGVDVGDEEARVLAKIRSLETLSLENTRVTAAMLEQFSGHPRLSELSLRHTNVTGKGLAWLAALPALKHLNLDGTPFGDKDVRYLVNASQIEVVSLNYTRLTDEGVSLMAEMRPRRTLAIELSGGRLTDSCLLAIRMIPRLTSLKLGNSNFTDRGIEYLASCASLECLALGDAHFTDACLVQLPKFRRLRVFEHDDQFKD